MHYIHVYFMWKRKISNMYKTNTYNNELILYFCVHLRIHIDIFVSINMKIVLLLIKKRF